MEPLERMLIENECGRLVTAYCHHVDHGNASAAAELFTKHGILDLGVMKLEGRESLERGFGELHAKSDRMSRHVCHDSRYTIIDQDIVEAITCVTLYKHSPDSAENPSAVATLVMVGEYRDRFERTLEGWRISSREIGVRFPQIRN